LTIALLVMTDGRRDCIERAVPSALEHLDGELSHRFIHDDSGDDGYRDWLRDRFPSFTLLTTRSRSGFGGAYRNAWSTLAALSDVDHVFSTEDDFVFNRRVDLALMVSVLNRNDHIVQLVLKRQAWSDEEKAAGGIIERHPADYTSELVPAEKIINWEIDDTRFAHVVTHRRFYSTNPSLHRRSLCERGWPQDPESEGHLGINLMAEAPDARFAFWGTKSDAPWVEHIGRERVGTGY
jgi:hypothetical protein